MSLVINSTLEYLQSRLNIPAARMQVYADKTIEQILEAEAAAGNQEAIKRLLQTCLLTLINWWNYFNLPILKINSRYYELYDFSSTRKTRTNA